MFGSPAWRKLFKHALSEAHRLPLEPSLNFLSGWNLGGPTVKSEQWANLLTWWGSCDGRVVRDGQIPAEQRTTHTNITRLPAGPLMPSGLLGPVTIRAQSR